MARTTNETERRAVGLYLRTRFTLSMSMALAVVMTIAGFLLVQGVTRVADANTEERIAESVQLTAKEGMKSNYEQEGGQATKVGDSAVVRYPIVYGLDRSERIRGEVYVANDLQGQPKMRLFVAPETGREGRNLLGLILGITLAVIAAGAGVSVWVAGQVASPLEGLVEDVRHISHGNLQHRTRVRSGGEVALLARAIDRMSVSLQEAQDAELELSARERELEVAAEVHEALLPQSIPQVKGYDISALQIGSPTPGGDFYDFIELEDGRLGVLLCEVSGKGVPGALVAATARSYLHVVLSHTTDVLEGFRQVNRYLARDVRRGMFVTAMYVLLEPDRNCAQVVCAGHKVPLLRFVSADRKMRTLQPEGIALGFDKGPVFDRALQSIEVEMHPGDRLLLSNTGPVVVKNADGEELGENAFFRAVLKRSTQDSDALLEGLDQLLDEYAGEEPFPNDIAILTLQREA